MKSCFCLKNFVTIKHTPVLYVNFSVGAPFCGNKAVSSVINNFSFKKRHDRSFGPCLCPHCPEKPCTPQIHFLYHSGDQSTNPPSKEHNCTYPNKRTASEHVRQLDAALCAVHHTDYLMFSAPETSANFGHGQHRGRHLMHVTLCQLSVLSHISNFKHADKPFKVQVDGQISCVRVVQYCRASYARLPIARIHWQSCSLVNFDLQIHHNFLYFSKQASQRLLYL